MSTDMKQYDAHVARLLAMSPFEQKMCVSMLGLDVWRMHRQQRIQPSLLLELHTPADEFDTFTWGISQVLTALPKTERFTTLDALTTVLTEGILKLSRHDQNLAFAYHCGVDVRSLAEQYGVDWLDNDEVQRAGELATFMLDCLFENSEKVKGFESWVQVWFDLCDAAAQKTATPSPAGEI